MVYVLLALLLAGVWLFALFDVLTAEPGDARHLPKAAWFVIVVLGLLPGAVAWLWLGRVRRRPRAAVGAPRRAEAPRGPDDDEAFLRDIERRMRDDD